MNDNRMSETIIQSGDLDKYSDYICPICYKKYDILREYWHHFMDDHLMQDFANYMTEKEI